MVMKLLSINSDAKTFKGEKLGWRTAIMYLAPYTISGKNLCPAAALAKCHETCLYSAGRGVFIKTQDARVARTRLFLDDSDAFFGQLTEEIQAFKKNCEKAGMKPCIRLNGTGDISWHKIKHKGETIIEKFSDLQFYDYTKKIIPEKSLPSNYYILWSFSNSSRKYADIRPKHQNWAVVFGKEKPKTFLGRTVIDGDEHDCRFLDPSDCIVGLKAKGKARKDQGGFVVWDSAEVESSLSSTG